MRQDASDVQMPGIETRNFHKQQSTVLNGALVGNEEPAAAEFSDSIALDDDFGDFPNRLSQEGRLEVVADLGARAMVIIPLKPRFEIVGFKEMDAELNIVVVDCLSQNMTKELFMVSLYRLIYRLYGEGSYTRRARSRDHNANASRPIFKAIIFRIVLISLKVDYAMVVNVAQVLQSYVL